MSDVEDNQQNEEVQQVIEEAKTDNINDAIKSVIKVSQAVNGLVKGLNEVCKCLDRKEAVLCVLADNCDDPKYKKLITALAKANNIPLIEMESRDDLGEWLGLCKYDAEGNARKVRGASSIAIKDYGEETEALSFVQNYIKENNL
mmetsp:Transcript_5434/g.3832  ORF Transcript_5434/g.3832 Transcript_5434/m.3832 type:complete len:145 (-) Transcript_5434:124-558(-)|eukprot:CAMPEP_0116870176 /NCGR_PEP_ID=MMETSP0463-20121206/32_1 /TAXON_ID=181622 /ORGANISM="Strombidinopsis sp, Strain SopsisLIS2011" /LENGTH=144 /DNA_ID=CAMNT_0004506347 /DNA_START=40 /DNA_END=474 /DNA_ORIENTATION=-